MDTVNTDSKEPVFVLFKRKQRQGPAPSLTPGRPYQVIDTREKHYEQQVLIMNDQGRNKWYHREDFEKGAERPSVADLEAELNELKAWKQEVIEAWAPLIEWGQGRKDLRVGQSITQEILRRLEDYDRLLALSNQSNTDQ